ncbi:temptin [Plakobranchus ocellatus]|uniref:Temptin n=1 Tax=Plakobranchus ocellatus TaxID=259542 RepID=A0AAV3YA37_9GAST|nr:temptin [Plakobranchus ocellatus]
MTDKSGMRLYYQPATADVQELVFFTVGTEVFQIPPGYPRYEVSSVCNTSCNRVIKKPAKIVAATNHMHYMDFDVDIANPQGPFCRGFKPRHQLHAFSEGA